MSGASTSTTRSDSAHSRIADSPTSNPAAADACFDTALPPMSSKQMVISTRRPPRASGSSLIATNLRNTNRAVATLPYTPPGTTTIARGPSTHRRTGSTLKTVMRKIFTRKSRGQEDDDSADCRFGNHSPRSNQSLDKPQPLSGSWNAKSTSPLQQEHGPVTSWEEALRKLEPHPRRRRATLPSLIFSDDESRSALEAVVHSGRPTSRRDNSPHANSDPDEVRRREMRQIKRRSRSATALRGMAKDHLMSPIQWRRRSLESYAGSTTFGAVSEADASERPPTRTTVASAPKPTTEPSFLDGPDEDDEEDAPEEPMPQMVGTLVNSLQHDENVTLEQRLTTLEVKLIDLECAIARIQSGRSETPAEPSGQRKPSPPTTRHKRKQSSAQSPSGSDETPGAKSPGGADRPSSTSTLRPNHLHRSRTLQAPSSTSLHECNTISVEQYSALVMLLRREQSARRNLEEQVSGLRSDVEQLTRVARESMGMGPIYPIPIDAHDIMRMRQALGPSPTNSGPPTEKISPDSDSEERPELPPKGDLYHPRWPSARRVEVGGMI